MRFHYRDRADGDRRKVASLPASQFIRRFLHHVLPDGFMRIRHYGFLANRSKKQALARCREHLRAPQPEEEPAKTTLEWIRDLTGIDITRCPQCGGRLRQGELPSILQPPPIPSETLLAGPPIHHAQGDYFDTS